MIIYKITNLINQKVYIGQTIQSLTARWNQHIKNSRNTKNTLHLYESIRKYGKELFKREIIDSAKTLDELNEKEIYWINFYNSLDPDKGYNNVEGGKANPMHNSRVIEKHLNKMRSEQVRAKISLSIKKLRDEKGFSQETRNKISIKLKGNQHYKGKKRPQSAIDKTVKSHFKSVYCIDLDGNVVKEFQSVKDAAIWWNTNFFHKDDYHYLMDRIKRSSKRNIYSNGLKWIYKLNCVETIEKISES